MADGQHARYGSEDDALKHQLAALETQQKQLISLLGNEAESPLIQLQVRMRVENQVTFAPTTPVSTAVVQCRLFGRLLQYLAPTWWNMALSRCRSTQPLHHLSDPYAVYLITETSRPEYEIMKIAEDCNHHPCLERVLIPQLRVPTVQ